jgi:hypothetical protein
MPVARIPAISGLGTATSVSGCLSSRPDRACRARSGRAYDALKLSRQSKPQFGVFALAHAPCILDHVPAILRAMGKLRQLIFTATLMLFSVSSPLGAANCDPNYAKTDPETCVPIADDVDCEGGDGDGPAYVSGPFQYEGSDLYDLDRDHDNIACEPHEDD